MDATIQQGIHWLTKPSLLGQDTWIQLPHAGTPASGKCPTQGVVYKRQSIQITEPDAIHAPSRGLINISRMNKIKNEWIDTSLLPWHILIPTGSVIWRPREAPK